MASSLLGGSTWTGLVMAQAAPHQTVPQKAATPYPACESEPDEVSVQGAQGAFQAGNASFNEADYPRAIFYWEDAYRRDCTAHAMLKNLARAYELNDQYEHAILALNTYLERNPDSGEADAIQRRIENLGRKLEEQRAAEAVPPPPKPEPKERREPQPTEPPPLLEADSDGFTDEDFQDTGGRSVVPLVIAGLGASAGVLGGLQWMVATQDGEQAEEDCGPGGRERCLTTDPETGLLVRNEAAIEAGNEAVDRQILWGIVGGAGAAVAVGGLIWYFAQPDGSGEEASMGHLTPRVGPNYAGLLLDGQF